MNINAMITPYNTAVTDAPSEILGKERRRKKPWVTKDVLNLCDDRREFLRRSGMKQNGQKNTGKQTGGFRKVVKKAKEDWIGAQCEEIKTCLNKNNSKRAY